MSINAIKQHGAVLGLEAELHKRHANMGATIRERDWTSTFSHAVFIQELSEELRKLEPKPNASQPIPKSN